jgi:hypothetical protein
MYKEKQRLNRSEREEVIPQYKYASPFYHQEDHEMQSLNKKLKILNLDFIMWLNKKSQFRALECLGELSRYL